MLPVAAILLAVLVSPLHAETYTWEAETGDWDVDTNWSGSAVPTSADTAIINNSGAAQLPEGVSGSYNELRLGTTFGSSGSVEIAGGILSGTSAFLGFSSGGNGSAFVSSGSLATSVQLIVGYGGNGTLLIEGGEVSSGTFGIIGYNPTANGLVTVTDGTLSNSHLYVGYTGTGSLLLSATGSISSTFSSIGTNASGTGSATVTGGTWNTSNWLTVGDAGTGELILQGGQISSGGTTIGSGTTGHGSATVTSGTWANSAGLTVGGSGTGSLTIEGGLVSNTSSAIGSGTTGHGTVLVTGGTWSNSSLLQVGNSGTGSLTIEDGLVSSDSIIRIGLNTGGHGSVLVTGGTLVSTNAGIDVGLSGTGSLAIEGGQVSTTSGVVIGNNVPANGTALVTGGTLSSGTDLWVGYYGTGSLTLGGGQISNGSGYIGYYETGNGTVLVSDGLWDNSLGLTVGESGSGALTLTGNGVVQVAAGSGTVTLARNAGSTGTLNIGSGGAATGSLEAAEIAGGDGTAVVNFHHTGTTAFSPNLTGSLAVNKNGSGTTVLEGANTYEGATTVIQGTLSAGGQAFSANSSVNLYNVATLDLGDSDQTVGGLTGNGTVSLGANSLTVKAPANTVFSGVIHGTGGVVKEGAGEWELQNSISTYSGGTTLREGALKITQDQSLGAAGGDLTFDGGTLRLAASPVTFTSARDITLEAGGGTLDTGTRTAVLNGSIDGTGSLTKEGTGSLTLTSANTYSGGTVIEAGSLWISADNRLGDSAGAVTLNGGVLGVTATTTSQRDFLLGGGAFNTGSGATHTVQGSLSGSGDLIKDGSGTLVLSGSNSYTGDTLVNGGILQFSSNDHLGSGAIILNGGGLSAAGNYATNQNLTLSAASSFEVTGSYAVDWDGQIDGATLTKTGSGLLRLSNTGNSQTSTVISAGTVAIQDQNAIGGSAAVNGGTLLFESSINFEKSLTVNDGALNVAESTTTILSGNVSGDYYSTLTKTGQGILAFSGNNTHAGQLSIYQGSVFAGKENAFSSHSGIFLVSSGTLDLGGYDNEIQNLSGTGGTIELGLSTLTVNSNFAWSSTFAGQIQGLGGAGGLVKAGPGTLTLSGNNTYANDTTVTGGALIFANLASLPDTPGSLTNLAYTGFAGPTGFETFLNIFDKANSSGTLGVNVNGLGSVNMAGFHADARLGTTVGDVGITVGGISTPQGTSYRFGGGGGRLNVTGNHAGARSLNVANGTVVLSGTNTYTLGSVAESGGILVFAGENSLPAAGTLTAQSGGYIGTSHQADQSFLDRFDKAASAGTVGFNASTSADLDLTGFHANARLGTTESVELSGSLTPQGSTYRFGGGGGSMVVSSALTGARSVDVANMFLTLSGDNDYSGGTVVASDAGIQVDSASRLGSGALTLYGSFLTYDSFTLTQDVTTHGGYFEIMNDVTLTVAGSVAGTVLQKGGWGTLALSGSNSHSDTEVYGGTLRLDSAHALGSADYVAVWSNAVLDLDGNNQSVSYLANSGTVQLGGAQLAVNSGYSQGTITGTGSVAKTGSGTLFLSGTNTHSGGTALQGGVLEITGSDALGSGALALSGGTLRPFATFSDNRAITTSGTSTIDVDSGNYASSLTLEGPVSGSGTIIKTGDGSMILLGDSSHSGAVDIQEGTVVLDGSTGSQFLVASAGAVLTGSGTTSGQVVVASGGTIAPGNSPGTLHVDGVEFGEGGIYEWEIAAPGNHDLISAEGTITITATEATPFTIKLITLDGNDNAGFMEGFNMAASYNWTIATGAVVEGFAAENFVLDLSAFYNPYTSADQFALSQQGNSLVLQYQAAAVPEPTAVVLLTVGLGLLALRRSRPISG